jgi:hypothetical protein
MEIVDLAMNLKAAHEAVNGFKHDTVTWTAPAYVEARKRFSAARKALFEALPSTRDDAVKTVVLPEGAAPGTWVTARLLEGDFGHSTDCGCGSTVIWPKIEAIKFVREITGLGLGEAKDLIEATTGLIYGGGAEPTAYRIFGTWNAQVGDRVWQYRGYKIVFTFTLVA